MRTFALSTGLLLLLPLAGCERMKAVLDKAKGAAPAASADSPASDNVREMSQGEFPGLIGTKGKLVVVVFHADWCGPCQSLKPIIATVAAEFPNTVVVGRFNVDHCQNLSMENAVRSIPDVRFFRDGKQVDKTIGLASESEIREKFKQHTSDLTPPPDPLPNVAATPDAPVDPTQPTVTRMKKDWMPPGMEKQKQKH